MKTLRKMLISVMVLSALALSGCVDNPPPIPNPSSTDSNPSLEPDSNPDQPSTPNPSPTIDPNHVYPIPDVPEELTASFDTFSAISTSMEGERGTSLENPYQDEGVSTLKDAKVDVYFDNTATCFNYFDTQEQYPDAWNAFKASMKCYRNTFELAQSCKVHTLQVTEESFEWGENSDDAPSIFEQFQDKSRYLIGTGKDFKKGESPMTFWIDSLKNGEYSGDISVLITDLNEQGGVLSACGKGVRELLTEHPEKDFLLISYKLKFTGKIYQPSFETEGTDSSGKSSPVLENVDRNYYAVAYGSPALLSDFAKEITKSFSAISEEIESVDMDAVVFQYSKYKGAMTEETETIFLDKFGRPVDDSFLASMPPQVSFLNEKGENVSPENAVLHDAESQGNLTPNEGLGALGGNQNVPDTASSISNLHLLDDVANRFDPKLTGEVFMFENKLQGVGQAEAEVSFCLENTDFYQLDTSKAAIYTYRVPSQLLGSDTRTGWVAESPSSDLASVKYSDNTVKIHLQKKLAVDSIPVLVVSVPVQFEYSIETKITSYAETEEVKALIERCNKPLVPVTDEEKYTRTYDFDVFMRQITDVSNVKDEDILSDDVQQGYFMTPNRLNFIIVSEPSLS